MHTHTHTNTHVHTHKHTHNIHISRYIHTTNLVFGGSRAALINVNLDEHSLRCLLCQLVENRPDHLVCVCVYVCVCVCVCVCTYID